MKQGNIDLGRIYHGSGEHGTGEHGSGEHGTGGIWILNIGNGNMDRLIDFLDMYMHLICVSQGYIAT